MRSPVRNLIRKLMRNPVQPSRFPVVAALLAFTPLLLPAQGTAADYQRAAELNAKMQGLVTNVVDRTEWVDANRFWYRKSVTGGNAFVLVDVKGKTKSEAFDHTRLANALGAATGQRYQPLSLPFSEFTFDGANAIRFNIGNNSYHCTITDYRCNASPAAPARTGPGRSGAASPYTAPDNSLHTFLQVASGARTPAHSDIMPGIYDDDNLPDEGPWVDEEEEAELLALQQIQAGRPDSGVVRSPDGQMEAFIRNYNIFIRPVRNTPATGGRGGRGGGAFTPPQPRNDEVQLSWDGSEGNAYVIGNANNRSVRWSPDSKKIAALRITPGYQRMVRYIESSPMDQLQPKFSERYYQKPGDVVAVRQPALFDVAARRQIPIDQALFPNAYSISTIKWWDDSRAFTFEYNQRGHQVYRVIEINANTGNARALISEEPTTFYSYRPPTDQLSSTGTNWRMDLADGKEIIWMSERDGWKHLYLFDGISGSLKNQITRGSYVVQNVQLVDSVSRRIFFSALGRDKGQDPYLTKFYSIKFDGTGLVAYTPEDGTHTITWSPDSSTYVDRWTRVDLPTITVLKKTADQSVIMEIETGDASALVKAGYQMAEPFVAKGRDGMTDIYGVIFKPTNFDPSKKYPVIEQIYAGPQGSFVPKTFSVGGAQRTLAEHGFIVVQIDGMGTANRSKAFHDVAWRNLGDAGFPDRVLWHKAVAAKYPWYDATRVGVYGTSAGGQNALGALLFHGDFYKAAFSAAGCHDNRMDKIWWNEQWMGWPIGPHYAASSNVDNAYKLTGDLLLVVGEMDTNVDPSSTYQVVNALVRANKMFDLLVLPGQGHTNGGVYGVRKMTDFFVRSLLDVTPPQRNSAG